MFYSNDDIAYYSAKAERSLALSDEEFLTRVRDIKNTGGYTDCNKKNKMQDLGLPMYWYRMKDENGDILPMPEIFCRLRDRYDEFAERIQRDLERRYPQGWSYYPGDTCPHGVYVGGCGVDYMCPACEE